MKLFQLKNTVNGFASINFDGIDMALVLKQGQVELLQGRSFSWDKSNGESISDCPFYIGALPIFDTQKLGNTFDVTNVKFAVFNVEGQSFTAVCAPHYDGEVINRSLSEMRTFRSGKIMSVKEYVLNAGFDYPSIFTPNEFPVNTFCDSEVARRLLDCNFSQLVFKECPIK